MTDHAQKHVPKIQIHKGEMTYPKTLRPLGDRKQIEKPTLATLENWFLLSWNPMDSEYESLVSYADRMLPSECILDNLADNVLFELSKKLHKCPARCPEQLRQWCYKQIDIQAARFNKKEKRQRKDAKPFPEFKQDGDSNIHIPLTDAQGQEHVWKIPADFLEQARSLWPVYVKKRANGKAYVARKTPVISPGKSKQTLFPAHHAFLGFKYPTISEGDIACSRARNGDFLDWTGDNLYVPAFDGKAVSESTTELRLKQAIAESSRKQVNVGEGYESVYAWVPVGIDPKLIEEWERRLAEELPGDRDILDCGLRADVDVELLSLTGTPAKPTRPPGSGPDMDDRKAWLDSSFYEGMERNTLGCFKES